MGYFKGWYFKCCTGDKTVAFIPAYHRNDGVKTASLQVITDESAFNIPFDTLEYSERPLKVKLGENSFSEEGIALDLHNDSLRLKGSLKFHGLCPIAYDIMGPFAILPFMQCRHSVYSIAHRIDGHIMIGDDRYDFNNGVGYIEGDRGRSFPKEYIWTQCAFDGGSLMLSVADIPFCGFHFTGIIGVILLDGKEYRIATYLGARVSRMEEDAVTVRQGGFEFTARLLQKNAQPLFAPTNGSMCRTIHESAACRAYYRFSRKGETLCEFVSDRAGFELEYRN